MKYLWKFLFYLIPLKLITNIIQNSESDINNWYKYGHSFNNNFVPKRNIENTLVLSSSFNKAISFLGGSDGS